MYYLFKKKFNLHQHQNTANHKSTLQRHLDSSRMYVNSLFKAGLSEIMHRQIVMVFLLQLLKKIIISNIKNAILNYLSHNKKYFN